MLPGRRMRACKFHLLLLQDFPQVHLMLKRAKTLQKLSGACGDMPSMFMAKCRQSYNDLSVARSQ